MTMLLRIAERVLNRPLLVHPDKLPLIAGVLSGRIPIDATGVRDEALANVACMSDSGRAALLHPSGSRFVGDSLEQDPVTGKNKALPYRRTADGVAVVTVMGSLVNRGAWLGASSGMTSYEGIKHQVAAAAADPRTKAILLDIESPGGEAVGAFEAADAIRAAAKTKPVTAVVNGMAASAAYALAAGANRIVTTPTGLTGSIGVVMMHADYSRFLDAKGVTPTLIFAGAHKVDGNPFEPLSPGVRDDLQAEVDRFYALFVKSVSAGRAGLNAAAIRATEARTFIGADAVKVGLADDVGTFESALAELSRGIRRASPSNQPKGNRMDMQEGAPGAVNTGISTEAHTAAVSRARVEGVNEGRKAAHDRISAILANSDVRPHLSVAMKLAVTSPDMSAEDIAAFVGELPKPAAAMPTIEQRMAGQGAALALGGPVPIQNAKASWDKAIAKLPRRAAS